MIVRLDVELLALAHSRGKESRGKSCTKQTGWNACSSPATIPISRATGLRGFEGRSTYCPPSSVSRFSCRLPALSAAIAHQLRIGDEKPVGSRTGAVFRRSSLACYSPFPLGVPH